MVNNEDQPHRAPGPELGDFTGLPINAAVARRRKRGTRRSCRSRSGNPGPPGAVLDAGARSESADSEVLDPVTQQTVAYTIAGGFGRADRVVWMDGRPHPSDYSEHTWDGFSTGAWENGQLVVTTTHMKQGVIQRNGVATSPYGVMTEHFFRHGAVFDVVLQRRRPDLSRGADGADANLGLGAGQHHGGGNPFEAVDELGDKPLGWVPLAARHEHREFAEVTTFRSKRHRAARSRCIRSTS